LGTHPRALPRGYAVLKLIIAGSRSITDYDLLKHLIVKSGLWKQYGKKLEIVSGMAKGVDALGVQFAKANKLKLWEFPADWTLGKSAGHIRNRQMGDFADGLLALWDGQSNGTKGMIDYARQKGLVVKAYTCHLMWATEEI
jgi:hypothetical protein